MIDIHSHMLFGIDDGPSSLRESVALLRAYVADGVHHLVLTPHFYLGQYPNTLLSTAAALSALVEHIRPMGLPISLQLAGEVRLDEHVPTLVELGTLPFLGECDGFRTVLLEMPDGGIPVGTRNLLQWLTAQRIVPVIAHPERNRQIRDDPAKAWVLHEWGARLQVTAGSLLGHFGQKVMLTARYLVSHQLASAVASDAHNLFHRPPMMQQAHQWLKEVHGPEVAHQLTTTGPAHLCGYSQTSLWA